MPLYMDFHTLSDITIEKLKNTNIADQAVHNRYNVKYRQCWVNEAAGTIFCLMEGPDKASCETVHREAYGNTACEIVEVVPGMHHLFMGANQAADHRLFLHEDGTVEVGYRFVLVIDFIGAPTCSSDYSSLQPPHKIVAMSKINKFRGKEVRHSGEDRMIAVFMAANDAVRCAVEMHTELREKSNHHQEGEWNPSFKIGLSGGQPIANDRYFEEAIQLAQRLSLMAGNQQIVATSLVEKMSHLSETGGRHQSIRVISPSEEKFLVRLFDIAEDQLTDKSFNVERLGRDMGISRPQLYRKIMSVTGHSPNGFIRNLRMQKAFSLIKKKQHNISEVALEVGIHNPSYFSKCFQERYGVIPSRVMC